MLLTFVLIVLLQVIAADKQELDQLSKRYNASEQEQALRKWNQTLKYITFDQTIEAFPFLKQNIKADKLADLVQAGSCLFINRLYFTRVAIVDNQVYNYTYFKQRQSFGLLKYDRSDPFINFLKVLTLKKKLPDMYFVLHQDDRLIPPVIQPSTHYTCRQIPLFSFNKNGSAVFDQNKFLIPDPHTAALSWEIITDQLKQESKKYAWGQKDNRMFFRGLGFSPHQFYINTDEYYDYNKHFHRASFVLLSLKYPDIIDARFTGYSGSPFMNEFRKRSGKKLEQIHVKQVPLLQHLKYRYILTSDGVAAAWTRVQFVLFTNCLLFKTQSQYIQWYFDKMIPGVHFVQIRDDLSDLLTKRQQMQNNITKVQQMIKNANKFAQQYLTVDNFIEVTSQILNKYAAIQNLTLTLSQKQLIKKGYDIQDVLIKRKGKYFFNISYFVIYPCLYISAVYLAYIVIAKKLQTIIDNN